MLKNRLFFCCFLFLSYLGTAQSLFTKTLDGKVLFQNTGVTDVHVMNSTTGKGTITNPTGEFSIEVTLGDTLLFSGVRFRRKNIMVTTSLLESSLVYVTLEEFVNELDEVVLRPFDLSGDLTKDMQQLVIEPVVTASTLDLPNAYAIPRTQAERKLFEATSGGGLVPLNPILNAITGRTKYLKKVLARNRAYTRTMRVQKFFPDSLYVQDLRIPKSKIDDFLYYCEVDTHFDSVVNTKDKLSIWDFMKQKSITFLLNNKLE